MKTTLEWLIAVIIMSIVCVFVALLLAQFAHAEDMIVTYYGQGVVSIEHNGVIHVMGKGEADKNNGKKELQSLWQSEAEETSNPTDLEKAEDAELRGMWLEAAEYYRRVGYMNKMEEMCYKEIKCELAKNPPYYKGAAWTATHYLKDKELAMEYYEKYLDQALSE